MQTWLPYQSAHFSGLVSVPQQQPVSGVIVLLHGVGANEQSLCSVGEYLATGHLVISLRAPLNLGANAYGWFQVQFTANGPVHNWPQALSSLQLLEKELSDISQHYAVPPEKITVAGFSQGAIMAMGLALQSSLTLGHYLCFSGRTLPQFATFAAEHHQRSTGRRIFLAHGIYDSKLPVHFARATHELLATLDCQLSYHEFNGEHEITLPVLTEAKTWLAASGR